MFSFFSRGEVQPTLHVDDFVKACAIFSLNVYGNDSLPLPPGWTIYHSASYASGYVGVCYARDLFTKNARMVVASRGTVLTSPGSVIADIQLALNIVPSQLNSMADFSQEVTKKVIEEYLDAENGPENLQYLKTSYTGHSLGAVLSELASLGMAESITFDNPGSKPLVLKLLSDRGIPPAQQQAMLGLLKSNARAFQSDVNLINTFKEQAATVYRLIDMPYDYDAYFGGPMLPISSSYYGNPYYWSYSLGDQHKIERISGSILTNGRIENVEQPAGLRDGYIAYLDGSRKRYWDEYIRLMWDRHPGMQEDYENDIEKFKAYFYTMLENTRRGANELEFSMHGESYEFSDVRDVPIEILKNAMAKVENQRTQFCALL